MHRIDVGQITFNGGELDPALHGRWDQTKYATGLATCLNMIPRAHGSVYKRPGTHCVGEALSQGELPGVLIPFEFSVEQAYALEFGHETMRIIKDDAFVVDPATNEIAVIPTPYSIADLERLDYAQNADLMILTHPNYRPRKLKRLDHHRWEFEIFSSDSPFPVPEGLRLATDGDAGAVYCISAVSAAAKESHVSDVVPCGTGDGDGVSVLQWRAVESAGSYKIYRADAAGGNFCLIGTASGTTFTDSNLAADKDKTPLLSDYPFQGPSQYPAVCAFFDQRLVFARTNEKPDAFWGSFLGIFDDFSKHDKVEDDDSYSFTLNSYGRNEIFWIVPTDVLLFGTSGSEWRVGGDNYTITPTNVNAKQQSTWGTAPVKPVMIGRSIVFAGRSRQVLRNLAYSLESNGYSGADLTIYSHHLFENRFIRRIGFQQEPNSIIWVVMTDGGLLSCTYLPDHQVVGWARHETQGRVEGVGSLINMDGSDRVYLFVTRQINGRAVRFIEVLRDSVVPRDDITSCFYVDCGLTYEGSPTRTISGLDHLEGCEVDVLADGNYLRTTVIDGRIALRHRASTIHVGLPYRAEIQTLDMLTQQQPIKNRPHHLSKADVTVFRTASGEIGPVDRDRGRPLIDAVGDGGPRLVTGDVRKNVDPPSASAPRGFKLRLQSRQPYPMCIMGINAIGDVGGN